MSNPDNEIYIWNLEDYHLIKYNGSRFRLIIRKNKHRRLKFELIDASRIANQENFIFVLKYVAEHFNEL